jgi:hypothetical protein
MSIALACSIRDYLPDIDIYCGTFTNPVTSYTRLWFHRLKVKYIEDLIFKDLPPDNPKMFLRTFTKDYFAKKLLDQYDYLIYLDVDVLMLGIPNFDFDPTSPMVLVDTMPTWIVNFHRRYLDDLEESLYYNWIEIINQHNKKIFDLDYKDPYVLDIHNADVIISNRINSSNLTLIEQNIGGYHCAKISKPTHVFYHYDSLGDAGSLHNIESTHPFQYQKYLKLFEETLNIRVTSTVGYWEKVAKEYS